MNDDDKKLTEKFDTIALKALELNKITNDFIYHTSWIGIHANSGIKSNYYFANKITPVADAQEKEKKLAKINQYAVMKDVIEITNGLCNRSCRAEDSFNYNILNEHAFTLPFFVTTKERENVDDMNIYSPQFNIKKVTDTNKETVWQFHTEGYVLQNAMGQVNLEFKNNKNTVKANQTFKELTQCLEELEQSLQYYGFFQKVLEKQANGNDIEDFLQLMQGKSELLIIIGLSMPEELKELYFSKLYENDIQINIVQVTDLLQNIKLQVNDWRQTQASILYDKAKTNEQFKFFIIKPRGFETTGKLAIQYLDDAGQKWLQYIVLKNELVSNPINKTCSPKVKI